MAHLKKYKHIFFDLDRTLWDFDKNSSETLSDIINEFSLVDHVNNTLEFIKIFNHYNEELWEHYREGKVKKYILRQERFRLLLNHFGINNKKLVESISRYYLDKYPVRTAMIEFASEIADYLSKKYRLHIISNGFYDVQLTKLINSGISSYFTKVFTSDRIGYAKPDVRIFEYAVSSLNAHKEECLMIGDDEINDITGAKEADIDQVLYNPKKVIISVAPTYEIANLLELKQIL
jgi:putative hydrolase of the HAD superfamily